MITLVKLGGSLITDKQQRATLRPEVLKRIAQEIGNALTLNPALKLVIGHGSGSFGHFEAKQFQTMQGVKTSEDWRGFARVATIAAELNYHVAKALQEANVPVIRFQPSASAIAEDGLIQSMNLDNLKTVLEQGLVPLVYGDVALDTKRGGTIVSTETVFAYLVKHLPVSRILLLGEVDGVWDVNKEIIPEITAQSFPEIQAALTGSGGVDVTGGMETKVGDMLQLASNPPYPEIFILNGLVAGRLEAALLDDIPIATRLSR